jgi:DNA-binding MarR family transcriptional regulator
VNERPQPLSVDENAVYRAAAVDGTAVQVVETMHKVAEVSRSLKSVIAVTETLVQTASQDSGLTLTHCLILVNLSRARTCKQSDLHAETGIAAGYLTRLIDDLYARRMVHRRRHTKDRRQILLSLTDHGKDTTLSLFAGIDQQRLLDAFDQLKSSLDRFMANSPKFRQ